MSKKSQRRRFHTMIAVNEEILRHSLTEALVARTALVDVEILGHRVPKGSDIFIMGNGPSVFSPAFPTDESLRSPSARSAKDRVGAWSDDDIAAFKPERWLVEENGKKIFNAAAGPLLTFGLGRLILMLVVWNFELQKCPVGLSSYASVDKLTHAPQQCYVNLKNVE
jgi:hypothetical protein